MKKNKPFMIHNVPEDIKDKFKKACLDKKMSMREAVIQFLQDYANSLLKEGQHE